MFRSRNLLSLVSILGAAACAESPNSSLAPVNASASLRGQTGCVATDAVASTEAQLRALLASAQPGDVVAVSGMVALGGYVELPEGVTLTCAAPGDGIRTAVGFPDFDLLEIVWPNTTVQGLRIIAHGGTYPIYVQRGGFVINGVPVNGNGARVIGNDVTCSFAACAFFVGAANGLVADNIFTAAWSGSGIHIQGNGANRVDGMQVLRNRIVATAPSGAPGFGAIRPRDGSDVVIADNEIVGPWSNGIATTMTDDARFERNSVTGATRFGLFVGTLNTAVTQVTGLLARNNTLNGAVNAIRVNRACTNAFVANKTTSASGTPVFFTATTGANNLLGGDNSVNVDNGAFDCDGDGSVDPNFLTGRKKAGAEPGETMRDVMPNAGRVQMH
jgi:hypothetical protein